MTTYICMPRIEKALEAGTKLGLNILFSIELTLVSTHSDYLVYGIDQSFLYKHEELYHYSLEELYQKICKENNFC